MLAKLTDWLDHRTGYRKLMDALLLEHVPGGAKWRYVWGSTLAFVFTIQLVTGLLLMTAYSPGDTTAWGSVYFIQYEMDFGWLIRGLHHFGSQTMVVLLGIHMLQVVIAGAHLPPREFNWWLGLALMGIVLGLSLTGYLLPWDQKGFFATQVATNILGSVPVVGSFLQKVVVGGPVYGNHTLTHFYALHVGVLPPLLIVLVIAHIAVFRRHGLTTPDSHGPREVGYVFHPANVLPMLRDLGIGCLLVAICMFFHIPLVTSAVIFGLFFVFAVSRLKTGSAVDGAFWPDQAFRDLVVCLFVFGVMLSLVVFGGHGIKVETPGMGELGFYESWAKAGKAGLGANLDAPADPLTESYPARPEWYFLFLFQLLKYFEGPHFLIGAVVIPNAVGGLLFLLPLFGYGKMRTFGHVFGVVVVVALLVAVSFMTVLAIADDSPEPYPHGLGGGTQKAKELHTEFEKAAVAARRAVHLAAHGIPEEGGRHLLRGDPLTKGPALFEKNCAVCHSMKGDGHDAMVGEKASDLTGFASEAWIRGLLKDPGDKKYFGHTKLEGMKNWRAKVEKAREKWKKNDGLDKAQEKIANEEAEFDTIAKWLADQAKPKKDRDAKLDALGKDLFLDTCASCHAVDGDGGKSAPDLTDYGSEQWIRGMVLNPAHPARYGKKNEMTAFRTNEGPGAEVLHQEFLELNEKNDAKANVMSLSDFERELIIRWMTRDFRVVFGGKTIAAPPK